MDRGPGEPRSPETSGNQTRGVGGPRRGSGVAACLKSGGTSLGIGEKRSRVDGSASSCGTGVTAAVVGGAIVDFAGGRSNPRLSLIGVRAEPLKVARTSTGTTHSVATITRMATRTRAAGDAADMRD